MMTFTLAPDANRGGTSWMGDIEVVPAHLIRRFGAPSRSDQYKVSGQYTFVDDGGGVFVLHDWKATSLYDPDLPSPLAFWNSRSPHAFTLSSNDREVSEFREWILAQLRCAI